MAKKVKDSSTLRKHDKSRPRKLTAEDIIQQLKLVQVKFGRNSSKFNLSNLFKFIRYVKKTSS